MMNTYIYDELGRPEMTVTKHLGEGIGGTDKIYLQSTYYDQYSRVLAQYDASEQSVRYEYNARGFQYRTVDQYSNIVYQQVMAIDAFGNVKQVKAGNDVTTSRVYDTLGRVTAIDTEHFGETIQNLNYVYDSVGNMKSREDVRDPSNVFYEEFTYDAVNRLDTVKAQTGSTPLIQTMGFEYDEGGRISDFNGNIYDYSVDSVHGVDSISGNSNKTFVYDANGNQTNSDGRTLIYSAFNKTTSMFNGGASVDFVYGSDNKRIKRIDTGNDENETTYYVGNVEFITNNLTNRTKIKRYIADTVITDYDDNTQEVKYLHKDHLGSVQSVTSKDFDTNTTQHLSFDAFGRRRDASNNTSIIVVNPIANVTKRGYTGQEHIDQLGIINFNARLYDPSLGIMLQADTIVPDGPVTQSMNRYSYVFNNPLSYTDPTGHKPFKFFSTQTEKAFAAADRHFENKREQRDNKKSENNKSVESKSASPVEGANDGTFRGNGLGILASPDEGTDPASDPDKFLDNEFNHPALAGDYSYDRNDPTFHHYDVWSPICNQSGSCNNDSINNSLLPLFSYPSKGLIPTLPSLDGRPVVAYIVLPLFGDINDPSDFTTPIGRVIQKSLPSGGIQNITLRDHGMFMGTISRQAQTRDGVVGIWTHGIGYNQFISRMSGFNGARLNPIINFINFQLAKSNDRYGPQAFQTMDRQAKSYWENHNASQ